MSRGALAGLRIAVTRTPEQASVLMESLEREGAVVMSFPLIRIEPVMDPAMLAAMLRQRWDWVVFTSANAVRLCAAALETADEPASGTEYPAPALGQALGQALGATRIATVGPATASAAQQNGLVPSAMPHTFIGDEVVAAMEGVGPLRGQRVLWPRAEAARDVVTQALRSAGATFEAPIVYRSVPDVDGAQDLARRILQQSVDVVTFTSPSCVRSLAAVLPELRGVKVAAIGPVTADAARAAGYPVDVVAGEYTAGGLVQALLDAHHQ